MQATRPGDLVLIGPRIAALGLAAQVTQVLLLREVLGQVEGSEVAVGAALAAWLIAGAAGALVGRRPAARTGDAVRLFVRLLVAATLLGAAALLAVRHARGLLPLAPGEAPDVLLTLLLALGGMAPPAVAFGAAFPAAARAMDGRAAWAWEALGALAGGTVFTFLLAPLVPPVGSASACVFVAGIAALGSLRRWAAVTVLAAGAIGCVVAAPFEHLTRRTAYESYLPGFELRATAQSPRGALDVLGLREQSSLYRQGHLDFTSPDPEGAGARAHLALCLHPAPRRALLIGGGPGVLREALAHPLHDVRYAEIDPAALSVMRPHLTGGDRAALDDARVEIVTSDARGAVRVAAGEIDVLAIFGLAPRTAAANRFYTEEFFAEAAWALAPGGVLVVSLPGFGEYADDDLLARNALVHAAAKRAFAHVRAVPGEAGYLVASTEEIVLDPLVLGARFVEREIPETGFTRHHFFLLLPEGEAERTDGLLAAAAASLGSARNTDATPSVYFRTFLLQSAEGGHDLTRVLGSTPRRIAEMLVLAALALLALLGRRGSASTAGTGMAAMSVAIVALLGFQSARGDLYVEVGLLSGLFMGGLAAGARLRIPLVALDIALAVLLLALPFVYGAPWVLCVAGAAAGLLTGATVPAALSAGGDPGRTYALDLAGAAVGALLVGAVLLPSEGVAVACAKLAGLKLLTAGALLVRPRR